MEPIKFYIGDESRIVVEKKNFQQSLFVDQYRELFALIKSLFAREKGVRASNVITICGDRGEGKSSFLYTAHNVFLDQDVLKAAQCVFPSNSQYDFSKIHPIRIIDPSYFDSEHNLIELLLGLMYADLRDYELQQGDHSHQISDKTTILKSFQKVKRSLSVLKPQTNRASAYDQLEDLDELAAAVTVRLELEELFSTYAHFFGKEKLMICVDDLDLNIEGGYQMAEDMRKYLSQSDHCIVLVALKAGQLTDVVKTYLRDKLNDKLVSDPEVEEMAIRYVTKLLPLGQRVWMPKGTDIVEQSIEMSDAYGASDTWKTVKEAVVNLIFKKTRYIFVNGAGVSPIVPTNLRNLRHLIGLLWNLPDAKKDDNQDNIENKQIFKHYFYQTWTKCLGKEEYAFVQELLSIENVQDINRFVVSYYSKYFINREGVVVPSDGLLKEILDIQNVNFNISLGDVYYILDRVNLITTDTKTKDVLFFTRAFYSMCLYDTYNYISIDDQHLNPNEKPGEPSIYKYDLIFQETNLLQRLVNGSYFSYQDSWLLAPLKDGNERRPRDRRLINAKVVWDNIEYIVEYIEKNGKIYEDKDKEELVLLNLCEFFALTTVCAVPVPSKNQTEFHTNRRLTTPEYLLPFAKTNNCLAFDALSIFYNMLNIKMAYNRFNVSSKINFYEIAENTPGSLLNKMREKCSKTGEQGSSALNAKVHGLISDAILRFSEVQMAIIDSLRNNRLLDKHRSSALNTYKLRCLYKDIQELGIALYPLEVGKKPYVLPFNFLTPIIDLLTNDNEHEFNRIFIWPSESDKNLVAAIDAEIMNSLMKWFGNAFGLNVKYPKTGDQVLLKLSHSERDSYRKCGGAAFWRKIFPKDKQYGSSDEVYRTLADNFGIIQEAMEQK